MPIWSSEIGEKSFFNTFQPSSFANGLWWFYNLLHTGTAWVVWSHILIQGYSRWVCKIPKPWCHILLLFLIEITTQCNYNASPYDTTHWARMWTNMNLMNRMTNNKFDTLFNFTYRHESKKKKKIMCTPQVQFNSQHRDVFRAYGRWLPGVNRKRDRTRRELDKVSVYLSFSFHSCFSLLLLLRITTTGSINVCVCVYDSDSVKVLLWGLKYHVLSVYCYCLLLSLLLLLLLFLPLQTTENALFAILLYSHVLIVWLRMWESVSVFGTVNPFPIVLLP